MAKRCSCRVLLEMMRHDPRLKLIHAVARYLFLMIADRTADAAEPGVFRFGTFFGTVDQLAALFALTKPDVETHLETLLQNQLLVRRDDGALVVPALAELQRRRGVGGRPRKDDTEETYKQRQRELRLLRQVPAGGAGNPAETQFETRVDTPLETPAKTAGETPPETQAKLQQRRETAENRPPGETRAETRSPKPATAVALAIAEEESLASASGDEVVKLGMELAELAGLDPRGDQHRYAIVRNWLRLPGATPERIREVIRSVVGRDSFAGCQHLGFFKRAVEEAAGCWIAPPPAEPPSEHKAALRKWSADLERWQRDGCYGKPPQMPAMAA